MPEKMLVTVEFRFVTTEDTRAIGERVREAVRMIVGRDAVEDFKEIGRASCRERV